MRKSTPAAPVSLGTRISLINFIFMLLALAGFIAALIHAMSVLVERMAVDGVTAQTKVIGSLLEASDRNLRQRTTELATIFRSGLSGEFQLDPTPFDLGGSTAPSLRLDGQLLDMNLSVVDRFTGATGAVATIFVKSGDDFIRVATSLKNERGQRVVGTRLDHAHPGYKATMDGGGYIGLASLFGRHYMTHYEPIKNGAGQVVGLLFVGIDFTQYVDEVRTTIRNMTIGTTGYFYILDARPGPSYGYMVVHPTGQGKPFLDVKDANGAPVVRTILEKGDGVIRYPWINKERGETSPRDKVVAFMTMKGWDWVIAGGTYVDEYTAEVRGLRNLYALLGAAIVLLTAAMTYWLLRRMVVLPLAGVSRAAAQVARGDLTVRLQARRPDEIGRLVDAINSIGSGLARVVSSVRQGAEGLAVASAEIAQGNHDLSARTEHQASALEQTASSMEELSAQVKQNADSARQADQLAANASATAAHGGEAMGRVVETMKAINDSSRRIADIVSVIDGIAFQTNILALNAAVEAARAGEQGRGFAVVASEVRSLAMRSAAAAKEIKLLVGASVERVVKGSTLIDDAGATMAEIVTSIQRVTEIVGEISSASREQAAGVSEMGSAVTQMDEATQQNAALVEQMAAAASSLKSQAGELVGTVATFKLEA